MSNGVRLCQKCPAPAKVRGLCKKHYDEFRRQDPAIQERQKNTAKAYRIKNRDKISKEYKEWYANTGKEHDRDRGLKRRYGIGIEDYNRLFVLQNGKCAICKSPDPEDDNHNFHVDHNHRTGEVRGLLCGSCNKMLGLSKDSSVNLRAGADYLDRFPQPLVKQVIVVRRKFVDANGNSMELRRGKVIAQASHASGSFLNQRVLKGEALTEIEWHWIRNGMAKICVYVNTEEELLNIYEAAHKAGLTVNLIVDAGKTEFNGVPTRTCLAVGPNRTEDVDKITGHLTLY